MAIVHCNGISSSEIPACLLTLVYDGIVLPNHSATKTYRSPVVESWMSAEMAGRPFKTSTFVAKK